MHTVYLLYVASGINISKWKAKTMMLALSCPQQRLKSLHAQGKIEATIKAYLWSTMYTLFIDNKVDSSEY